MTDASPADHPDLIKGEGQEEEDEEEEEEEENDDEISSRVISESLISYFDGTLGGEQLLNVRNRQNLTLDEIEKYRFRMIEAFPDPTCVCDQSGNIILSNARFQEQIDPGDNLRGKNLIKSIIFEEDQGRIMTHVQETLNSLETCSSSNVGKLRTYINSTENGGRNKNLANVSWTISKDNSILYGSVGSDGRRVEKCALLLIGRLTHGINNTKAEVREALELFTTEELRRTAEEKERLIRRLVHQLRTPLHLASSLMAAANKSVNGQIDTNDSSIPLAEKQIHLLTDTVEDLAFLMSDELGETIVPNLSRVKFVDLIDSLTNSLSEEYSNKRLHVLLSYKDVPDHVYADRRLLSRVYNHLIANSFKYVADGGTISIALESSKIEKDGEYPKFSLLTSIKNDLITDSNFFSTSNSSHVLNGMDESVGLGVGLKAVRKSLDAMNSDLHVTQTTLEITYDFTLMLNNDFIVLCKDGDNLNGINPYLQVSKANERESIKLISCGNIIEPIVSDGVFEEKSTLNNVDDSGNKAAPRNEEKKWKVLVTDDSIICRRVARKIVESLGLEAIEACDGVDAVHIMQTQGSVVGCILMDLRMPRMNGIEAIIKIRKELESDVPIVALSAEMGSITQLAVVHGANMVVSKPASFEDLRATFVKLNIMK